jgi:hypothetical protein
MDRSTARPGCANHACVTGGAEREDAPNQFTTNQPMLAVFPDGTFSDR